MELDFIGGPTGAVTAEACTVQVDSNGDPLPGAEETCSSGGISGASPHLEISYRTDCDSSQQVSVEVDGFMTETTQNCLACP